MCGIAGIVDFQSQVKSELLQAMINSMHHRGPDDSGIYLHNSHNYSLGLCHVRLSIIDLSSHGHQPFLLEDGKLACTFNGEIYNYQEIRKELESLGYSFRTATDTEVLLQAFHAWKTDCLHRLRGMFAFAIFDARDNKLFVVRDRPGIKPLYVYSSNDRIIFGSELKPFFTHEKFKRDIDPDAVSLYLQYGYIPYPYSIFKNTQKVSPGHFLEVDLNTGRMKQEAYWAAIEAYNQPKFDFGHEELVQSLESTLKESFQYRMVSDVPVGVFLSGGYDSTAVTAILQADRTTPIKTFTIGFHEKEFDEAPYAREVAERLGTHHHELYCSHSSALDILPKIPIYYDEPFGDSSALPTMLVSHFAKQHVKVALSADGADEVFGGYGKYFTSLKYYSFTQRFPRFIRPIISKLMDLVSPGAIPILGKQYNFPTRYEKLRDILISSSPVKAMEILSQMFTCTEVNKLMCNLPRLDMNTAFTNEKFLNSTCGMVDRMLCIDYLTYMNDDILHKVDRATMSVSLEGREPFLDHKLLEFVARLPEHYKLNGAVGKAVLKEIVHKYVPPEIMARPKKGFAVPLASWFRGPLRELLRDTLCPEALGKHGLFDIIEVQSLLNAFYSGIPINPRKLWFLLMFQMWHDKWIDNT
jgi:asparagine synthase (glutamine-hydrolysing)